MKQVSRAAAALMAYHMALSLAPGSQALAAGRGQAAAAKATVLPGRSAPPAPAGRIPLLPVSEPARATWDREPRAASSAGRVPDAKALGISATPELALAAARLEGGARARDLPAPPALAGLEDPVGIPSQRAAFSAMDGRWTQRLKRRLARSGALALLISLAGCINASETTLPAAESAHAHPAALARPPLALDGPQPAAHAMDSGEMFSRSRPPPIRLEWGLPPRFVTDARLIEDAHHLLGFSGDRLLEALPLEGAGKISARLGKAITLDIAPAVFGVAISHEWGHFKAAWNVGAKDIAFLQDPDGFFGAVPTMGAEDYEKLDASERLEFDAGGLLATQTASDDARRRMLARGLIDASYLPWWFGAKVDISAYVLLSPKLGTDVEDYMAGYSPATGRSLARLHGALLKGALLNALDPMALWAVYAYFYRYLILGEERLRNPLEIFSIGDIGFMPGTGFWLSRLGPQYRFLAFLRHNPSGTTMMLAPTLGDRRQWTLEAEISRIPVLDRLWLKIFGGLWSQRGQAEGGKKSLGGFAGGGIEVLLWDPVGFSIEGGYKSKGALLGRGFEKGAFLEGGLVLFGAPQGHGPTSSGF